MTTTLNAPRHPAAGNVFAIKVSFELLCEISSLNRQNGTAKIYSSHHSKVVEPTNLSLPTVPAMPSITDLLESLEVQQQSRRRRKLDLLHRTPWSMGNARRVAQLHEALERSPAKASAVLHHCFHLA